LRILEIKFNPNDVDMTLIPKKEHENDW
jgi:hypothetical protein